MTADRYVAGELLCNKAVALQRFEHLRRRVRGKADVALQSPVWRHRRQRKSGDRRWKEATTQGKSEERRHVPQRGRSSFDDVPHQDGPTWFEGVLEPSQRLRQFLCAQILNDRID